MVECGEGEKVGGYVFADRGVGTAACFDCSGGRRRRLVGGGSGRRWGGGDSLYAFWGEGVVFCEEFGVFACEDVVGYGCDAVFVSEGEAEGEH